MTTIEGENEIDEGPLAVWADAARAEYFAEELHAASALDEEAIEAGLAFLAHFATDPWVAQDRRLYTAEQVATLIEDQIVTSYNDWAQIADLWFDDHGGDETVTSLSAIARRLGHQDVWFEILTQAGRDLADADRERYWWYESGLLATGHVFCFTRP